MVNAILLSPKVADLRKELKDRGISLPASAKKSDLVSKLKEVLESGDTSVHDSSSEDLLSQTLEELTGGSVSASIPSTSPVKTSPVKVSTTPAANGQTAVAATTIKLVKPAPIVATVTEAVPAVVGDAKVTVTKADPAARLAARAARFGVSGESPSLPPSTSSSLPAVSSINTTEQLAALKKRSERFGEVLSPVVKTLEVKEKLSQRANRFNLTGDEASPAGKLGLVKKAAVTSPTEKRSAALSPEEEEKIKKRRERFGLT